MTYHDHDVIASRSAVVDPPRSAEVEPVPNEPNKAIAAILTALVALAAQWAASKGFDLDQEGITAALTAVVGIIVYLVSNQKRLFNR